MLAVEERLLKKAGLSRAIVASQLYRRANTEGTIVLLICKLSDVFLIAREGKYHVDFLHHLKTRFDLDKISTGRNRSFGG